MILTFNTETCKKAKHHHVWINLQHVFWISWIAVISRNNKNGCHGSTIVILVIKMTYNMARESILLNEETFMFSATTKNNRNCCHSTTICYFGNG